MSIKNASIFDSASLEVKSRLLTTAPERAAPCRTRIVLVFRLRKSLDHSIHSRNGHRNRWGYRFVPFASLEFGCGLTFAGWDLRFRPE